MNAMHGEITPALQLMEFEGDTKVLFPAFIKAQSEMGEVLKTSANDAFKRGGQASKYADLGAVIDAVLPALQANGFGLMQPPHSDGALVEVETILLHTSGGLIRSTLGVRPTKMDPQGIGSAITYARRYALQSIAGIAPEDDDGNAASGPRQQAASAEQVAVNLLRTARSKGDFKTLWEGHKDGWRKVMDDRAYARVVGVMKEVAASFTTPTAEQKPAPKADDFGLGGDDVPAEFH